MAPPTRLCSALLVAAFAAGCGGGSKSIHPDPPEGGGGPVAEEPAAPACDPAPEASETGPLAWYHDDYEAARACAQKTGRPLVIDLWAPWCHTCLSMKQTVLVDRALEPLADRFVWLAVDTDREVNAEVVNEFPPAAWPTFYVVSPESQEIQARLVGGSSLAQFRELLVAGERAYLDGKAGTLPEGSPLVLVRDAHRAEADGRYGVAAELYGKALAAAPADWPRRPDLLVQRIGALYRAGHYQECMALGAAKAEQTGRSASAADFAYYAMSCAAQHGNEEASRALLEHLFGYVSKVVDDPEAPLSVDDRADALRILREMKEALGDEQAAVALAERQKKLLDEAITEAPTPFAAMTYNWPAAEVYVYLDRAEELIPVLETSVADLPSQYDPPYRLAWVLAQVERYDEALKAAEQARSLAYGPRKARVQGLIANIHRAQGNTDAHREALEEVVRILEALPEGQRDNDALQQARRAVEMAE